MVQFVILASNLLRVDEFEIFRLAHRFWNHNCDESHTLHIAFNKYLRSKVAPPWVVHFSRHVVQAYQNDNFDPVAFGVYPPYEVLPWSWSVALHAQRYVKLKNNCDVFVA